MEDVVRQIEIYIKKTLANEIAKETDKDKIEAFVNTLNDLLVNNKELENIICVEFAFKNDTIYITRCSKTFCVNKDKCRQESCTISDFIGFNPDTSEYLFKKMEEKINEIRSGYLKKNSLYDYIEKFLGDDDDLFDVMIVNGHVIINEEIENKDSGEIIDDYLLQSLKSVTTKKINAEIHSDQMRNLFNYAVETNLGFIRSMWGIFQETQSFINENSQKEDLQNSQNKINIDNRLLTFSNSYQLSEREQDVLIKVLEGYNTKEIGDKLFISPGTARNHIQNIFEKTETHSRIELFSVFNKFSA